jgi:membrane protease YdiL (CAAX protease family)
MIWVLLITLGSALGIGLSTRPEVAGSTSMWLSIAGCYFAVGALAVWRLRKRGSLLPLITPRWGDASIGAVTAVALLFLSWVGRSQLAAAGSTQQFWLALIYLQLGDPRVVQNSLVLTTVVILVALTEELVWRGFVQEELTLRFGERAGWAIGAALYALAAVPSVFTLAAPLAGPNPLLVLASLGAGLVWAFMVRMTGRLAPAMIAHAAFTYFTVAQFRTPGL